MFNVSIEKYETRMDDSTYWEAAKVLKTFSSETKKEANAQRRKIIKEYDMVKLGYTYVNFSKGIEISTNY